MGVRSRCQVVRTARKVDSVVQLAIVGPDLFDSFDKLNQCWEVIALSDYPPKTMLNLSGKFCWATTHYRQENTKFSKPFMGRLPT